MKKADWFIRILSIILAGIGIGVVLIAILLTLSGCREVNRVSYNIGQEADNFNVSRRIVVINARTDKPVFEMIGNFSLQNNSTNELEIVCEVGKGVYQKHFIYLNEWTLYVVEDLEGTNVDKYHYEVNYLPQMIQPFTVVSED